MMASTARGHVWLAQLDQLLALASQSMRSALLAFDGVIAHGAMLFGIIHAGIFGWREKLHPHDESLLWAPIFTVVFIMC